MKNANEVAKITTAIENQAKELIMNKFEPIIIKRAEEGRKDASIDLLKEGIDYEMACRIGPKIKAILENEFDYVVQFINSSSWCGESAYIVAQWGVCGEMRILNKDLNEVIDGFKVVANLMPDFKCRAILGMTETLDAISSVDIPDCFDVRDIGRGVLDKLHTKLLKKCKEQTVAKYVNNEIIPITEILEISKEDFEECFLEMIEEYNL